MQTKSERMRPFSERRTLALSLWPNPYPSDRPSQRIKLIPLAFLYSELQKQRIFYLSLAPTAKAIVHNSNLTHSSTKNPQTSTHSELLIAYEHQLWPAAFHFSDLAALEHNPVRDKAHCCKWAPCNRFVRPKLSDSCTISQRIYKPYPFGQYLMRIPEYYLEAKEHRSRSLPEA